MYLFLRHKFIKFIFCLMIALQNSLVERVSVGAWLGVIFDNQQRSQQRSHQTYRI